MIRAEDIKIGGFTIPDPPTDADLLRCVHCGLCLNHCPTYRLTSLETESPRGRIFLIKELAEGKQTVNDAFEEHIGLCLNCRNCETVCPSGVRYSVLLEAARGEIVKQGKLSAREKFARWAVFKQMFPYPWRLNLFVGATGIYQRTVQPLVRKSGILKLFGRLGEMEGMLPADRKLRTYRPNRAPAEDAYPARDNFAETSVSRRFNQLHPAPAPVSRGRVALFTGCIMRAGFANIHEATVRVLERSGYEVHVPEGQICCAALHVHAGERDIAKGMARRNIELFMREKWDAIVINAAGCGAQLKDYPELFRDDPALYHQAEEFAKRTRDVSELLAAAFNSPLPLGEGLQAAAQMSPAQSGSLLAKGVRRSALRASSPRPRLAQRTRVTYQDACHLAHAQKVRLQPRQVLSQIGNLELVEMRASDRCCGSAGIYNVVHPEMSDQLIDEKMINTRDTRAEIVVTGNIGCLLQLEYGKKRAGWNGRVLHLVELLDEAYRNS